MNYFGQLFTIYCNKIHEVIACCCKTFEPLNVLLQQHIYQCVKVVIKISKIHCSKSFYCTNLLSQILLQYIKYCNYSNTIAIIFCCCNKHYYVLRL